MAKKVRSDLDTPSQGWYDGGMTNNDDLIAKAKAMRIANRKARNAIKAERAKQGFTAAALIGFTHNGNFNHPYKAG